jgi:hypothetical protein
MSKKLTTEEFTEKAKLVHGDTYDYSLVDYKDSKEKVEIVCKKHGSFSQIPSNHLFGSGCLKCGNESAISYSKSTLSKFIENSVKVHGDKYNYDLSEYVNWETKLKVICNTCKNIFEVSPNNHTRGRGCRQCGIKRRVEASFMRIDEFISRAESLHNNKYDYSKVEYINSRENVIVVCPTHGEFKQSPSNHLAGQGCKKCGRLIATEKTSLTNNNFIKKSNTVHNSIYDYSKVNYINGRGKVIIGCKLHGDFEQEASSHMSGTGCPKCALEFDSYRRSHYIKLSDISTLYLIKAYNEDESFYKIGKTINKTKKRFSGKLRLPYKYDIVNEHTSEIGEIYDLEIDLHRKYKQFQYFPKINFAGYTECYSLELPTQEIINLSGTK